MLMSLLHSFGEIILPSTDPVPPTLERLIYFFDTIALPSTNSPYCIPSGRYSYLRQIQARLGKVLVVTALCVCPAAFLRRLTSTFDNGIADNDGPQHSFGEIILPSTNS